MENVEKKMMVPHTVLALVHLQENTARFVLNKILLFISKLKIDENFPFPYTIIQIIIKWLSFTNLLIIYFQVKNDFTYIAGGIAGAVVFFIFIALLIWMICLRATKRKEPKKLLPPPSTDPNGSQVSYTLL